MGRQPRIHHQGAIYHAFARGNSRQRIFFESPDYEKFLKIIKELKIRRPFLLHAYCLMPNHVHLLVEPSQTNISTLMGILLSRYAKYFNLKFERVGHVFQDRFKAPLCAKDSYFKQLVRYIHLNPVRAELVENPAHWPFSSHSDYAGTSETSFIDRSLLLSMMDENSVRARALYADFMESTPSTPPIPVRIEAPPRRPVAADHNYGPLNSPAALRNEYRPRRISLDELRKNSSFPAGSDPDEIFSHSKTREICEARREFGRRALLEGYSLTEIASYLRISLSAVSRARARSQEKQASQPPAP
mgnify:CR=1 FL=1